MFNLFDTDTIESPETMSAPRFLKREAKRKCINALKQEHLSEILHEIEKGYTYHIISNGKFDFWTFTPVLINQNVSTAPHGQ